MRAYIYCICLLLHLVIRSVCKYMFMIVHYCAIHAIGTYLYVLCKKIMFCYVMLHILVHSTGSTPDMTDFMYYLERNQFENNLFIF